ncbi:hypothetical protein [Yinghuangia sp. YIM S10712]|uniref:hypothetical protein n=1 Tax=Yinghuangia sp. YIM S10712 TaxID=3436930 RepID=UPI003F53422A
MDLLIGIGEKSLSALAASALSLLGLRLLRPRIDISRQITSWWSDEHQEMRYSIKIVNKSRRGLVEPRFELTLLYENAEGRTKSKLIPRGRQDPMAISGRKKGKRSGELLGTYVVTYGGEDADLLFLAGQRTGGTADRARFRFRCFVRDSFSAVGRQFEMEYEPLSRTVVFGSFDRGYELTITPREPNGHWQPVVAAAFGGGEQAHADRVDLPHARGDNDTARSEGGPREAHPDGRGTPDR